MKIGENRDEISACARDKMTSRIQSTFNVDHNPYSNPSGLRDYEEPGVRWDVLVAPRNATGRTDRAAWEE